MSLIVDDRTSHLNLPLPHVSNWLKDDVARLRTALQAIDGQFEDLADLLSSDDLALDTLQEIVGYIKENRDDITAVLLAKLDKTEFIDRYGQPSASVPAFNLDGTTHTITDTLPGGGTRVTTFTYNLDGTTNTVTIVTPHYTRTQTYSYVDGVWSGTTAIEV
jgi:hypothetical protein